VTYHNSTPARTSAPPGGRVHAALQRAVTGVLLLILAGCEFDAGVGWEKERGSNSVESVKAEMKLDGGL